MMVNYPTRTSNKILVHVKKQMNLKTIMLSKKEYILYDSIDTEFYRMGTNLLGQEADQWLPEALLGEERNEGCVESQTSHFATTLEKYLQAS